MGLPMSFPMCSRPVLLLGKYNSCFHPLWHQLRPILLLELDTLTHTLGQGIHNLFIVILQFLVTGLLSIVFVPLNLTSWCHTGTILGMWCVLQGACAGRLMVQEAREIVCEGGGMDSIFITFLWGSLYGLGRTSCWLILARICAHWMCCNHVGSWRTN